MFVTTRFEAGVVPRGTHQGFLNPAGIGIPQVAGRRMTEAAAAKTFRKHPRWIALLFHVERHPS
ncbi:MAG: hypothetical protein ACE5EQ_10790 [Phycisphaerae bacterium]